MNISSQIFPTDGAHFSDDYFYNGTEEENRFLVPSVVDIIIILFGLPINSYVIWLIVTGAGNGLAAELFSLNHSACEMLFCMESLLSLISYKIKDLGRASGFVNALAITGRPLFQCLLCVERYLAVVHPVTFLKYKPLRYRVICCVIAWVLCFISSGIFFVFVLFYLSNLCFIFIMVHLCLFFSIQLYCLVAVLRALKQSGPGERKGEREENHMKRRAFYLILITTFTMLIIFFLFSILISISDPVDNVETIVCVAFVCYTLVGLVQPLLFLYRVAKPCFIKCQ